MRSSFRYARNTPGSICRYKEDGLVSRPPSLFTSMHRPMDALYVMPIVSTQVYMLDRKIWKLFRPRGNGRKRTKCDQFFCPTSDFFDFLQSIIPLPMMWILLTKMQKSVTTVCLHCSFARLKNKHTQQADYFGPQCLGISFKQMSVDIQCHRPIS